ncbi:MAG: DMT family transporter [Desulfobacterales bacterium]
MPPSSTQPLISTAAVGTGYAFLAASLFAMLNVVIRMADPYMTVWHMMFGRSLFGIVAMGILARAMGIRLLGVHRGVLTVVGLAGVTGVTSLTAALVLIPLFDALVLLYLFPAFAALLSPWLTGDRVSGRQWRLIALACMGAGFVLWSGELGNQLQWGHLLALSAAFFYGLALTLTRRVSGTNSPLTPFYYISAAGCLVCVGPLLWQQAPLWPDMQGFPALAGIAVLGTAAHLSTNKALSYLPSPQVGVISMAEVVFGAVFGFFLFGEPLGWGSLAGGVLILASGIRLNAPQRRLAAGKPVVPASRRV